MPSSTSSKLTPVKWTLVFLCGALGLVVVASSLVLYSMTHRRKTILSLEEM